MYIPMCILPLPKLEGTYVRTYGKNVHTYVHMILKCMYVHYARVIACPEYNTGPIANNPFNVGSANDYPHLI